MRSLTVAFGASFALAVAAGGAASCAKGSSETSIQQIGGSSPTSRDGTGGTHPGTTSRETSTDTGVTSSSSATGAGGFGGGFGGGSSSSGSGGGCDHTGNTMCAMPQTVADISGDTGNDTRVENGTTSAWYKLEVTEDSDLPTGLSYTVSLQSPADAQFDLFVYEGDNNGVSCTVTPTQGFGNPAQVHNSWGDSYGSDDGRYLIVEVRYVSGGSCGNPSEWTLTIEGDT
ncbi:MAG TPA: hypothetical protein VHB21_11640 [Minicystis sp.]|nr:hypothetical protein [Minicystis sp.]